MVLFARKVGEGVIIAQDTEPEEITNGVFWADTGDDPPTLNVSNGSQYSPVGIKVGNTVLRLDYAMLALG